MMMSLFRSRCLTSHRAANPRGDYPCGRFPRHEGGESPSIAIKRSGIDADILYLSGWNSNGIRPILANGPPESRGKCLCRYRSLSLYADDERYTNESYSYTGIRNIMVPMFNLQGCLQPGGMRRLQQTMSIRSRSRLQQRTNNSIKKIPNSQSSSLYRCVNAPLQTMPRISSPPFLKALSDFHDAESPNI
ncbi:hypothetical protein L249_5258 [Ophiocordyceps polyrhachis-furcata BCC 54312]|uniref:Uncharacterized protein n=1 Tax=Ophiocordyceps polyrhachis-furcata BCC 54312 TaxID=1330021 RepID=A0A367L9C2_9HYPO|nr:hypothetical protein L249_5258 [Ophiocordyceps polyrhachis-furcata BCC 54312]